MRSHYAANRKRCQTARAAKFARMRAAKERLRIERATAEPALPDTSHVKLPPRTKAALEIRVRIRDRWFCFSAHEAPWGGFNPSISGLLRAARTALALA